MQKLEKRASILLWAIFLSMAIFIAFVSINHQISKNLEENNKISEIISLNNEKNLKINEAIEKDLANIKLFHDEIIIFEDNNHQIWLKKWEQIKIKFLEPWELTIKIIEWGPVESSSWIISKSGSIISDSWSTISIKNLSWYSRIQFINENKFEKQYKKYKILKKIWDKLVIKESWKIKIF